MGKPARRQETLRDSERCQRKSHHLQREGAALDEVQRLWGAASGTPHGDRLDVLATLIDAYETQHFPLDPPDPIDAIRFRMEQQGLTRKDLESLIGGRGRIAEVLSRKRGLSIAMIRQLHATLGISAEVLIRPSARRQTKEAAGGV